MQARVKDDEVCGTASLAEIILFPALQRRHLQAQARQAIMEAAEKLLQADFAVIADPKPGAPSSADC